MINGSTPDKAPYLEHLLVFNVIPDLKQNIWYIAKETKKMVSTFKYLILPAIFYHYKSQIRQKKMEYCCHIWVQNHLHCLIGSDIFPILQPLSTQMQCCKLFFPLAIVILHCKLHLFLIHLICWPDVSTKKTKPKMQKSFGWETFSRTDI